jgi:hypothetical protein
MRLAPQMVERQFEGVFPGRVLRVRLGVDTRAIDGLIREYWRTRQKAVDLLDEYESLRQRRRSVKRRKVPLRPVPVPPFAGYSFSHDLARPHGSVEVV